MKATTILVEEQRREDLVRALACPTCGTAVDGMCRGADGRRMFMSHVKRYQAAADALLVPRLPWMD